MRTARTIEAEWRQVLWGSVSTGINEDESSTVRVWAAGFHHVMARSRLAHVLKLMNSLFLQFSNFYGGRSKLCITETADTDSADTGPRLYSDWLQLNTHQNK
jgi:hypothetical protein